MPTITEIRYPFMKYCDKHDMHCSCLTCNKKHKCNVTNCDECNGQGFEYDIETIEFKASTDGDRHRVCHSIYSGREFGWWKKRKRNK